MKALNGRRSTPALFLLIQSHVGIPIMDMRWEFSCFVSRWRNRLRYLIRAPFVFKNWWAILLPKMGVSVVLELRNGLRYLVRAGTTDLSVVNEASMMNPYLGN